MLVGGCERGQQQGPGEYENTNTKTNTETNTKTRTNTNTNTGTTWWAAVSWGAHQGASIEGMEMFVT